MKRRHRSDQYWKIAGRRSVVAFGSRLRAEKASSGKRTATTCHVQYCAASWWPWSAPGTNPLPRSLHRSEYKETVNVNYDAILWKVSSGWHENYINYSNTTKITYYLSTFRLHVGSLHQDWLPVPVVSMNRDEGSYQLSHVWDKLLHADDRHRKSVLMKASDMKP